MTRRFAMGACLSLPLWLALTGAGLALDRPGGGQGYSGGSGGGSYGGGGGESSGGGWSSDDGGEGGAALAELVVVVLKLSVHATREYPLVMWPVWGLLGVGVALRHRLDINLGDWTSDSFRLRAGAAPAAASGPVVSAPPPPKLWRARLEKLRDVDPAFSLVLFEDFVYALYAQAHTARGAGRLDELGGYLSPEARATLAGLSAQLSAVDGIIVGSLRYEGVRGLDPAGDRITVELEIEANYTEVGQADAGTEPRGYWVTERWRLLRPRSARSLPPERVRSFGCPGCGAPVAGRDQGVCEHCGRAIQPSDFDWLVDAVLPLQRRRTAPALTADTVEAGTWLDTIVDPAARDRRAELEARDPQFGWAAFDARVRHIFAELQPAWSLPDLAQARPYLSDNLFQTWRYWIDAYRRAGLRNVSEGARVTGMRLARVTSDLYFDAITVRLRATGLDYTVDTNGHKVAGSRDEPRDYSEYWTLVRGRGASGAPRTDKSCPRCGSPLAVNMAGNCESCGAHVSSGEFDWVLSRVEQDEAYQG